MRRLHLMLAGGLGVGATFAAAVLDVQPRLVWNATASAPEGLYWISREPIASGDLVAVRPAPALARWLDRRGYVPEGALLMKQVAAVAPSLVCRQGEVLRIDGVAVARVQDRDREGRALPTWSGCRRLSSAEIFLVNAAPGSLDSRYFGPLRRGQVVGRAVRLWPRERA